MKRRLKALMKSKETEWFALRSGKSFVAKVENIYREEKVYFTQLHEIHNSAKVTVAISDILSIGVVS